MVSRCSTAVLFRLVILLNDALVVGLLNIVWNTFHAKDLNIKGSTVTEGIVDACQSLLMDLVHVHRETCEELRQYLFEIG